MGRTFAGPSWIAWRTLAKAIDGLPLDDNELRIYQRITGRQLSPLSFVREFIGIAGRRSGKTTFAAGSAVHAAFEDYSDRLAPGEQAAVGVVSPTQQQSGVMLSRIAGLIDASPVYRREVVRQTADEIELGNGNRIITMVCNFRTVRGPTWCQFIIDEASFLRSDESALPDVELVRAALPGLSTLRGRLVLISSPWARRGYVYQRKARHYANAASADVLVAKGDTLTLNPTFDRSVIEAAYTEDAVAARTEWGAEDREDINQHFTDADIDDAVVPDRKELPPMTTHQGGAVQYYAFVDPSGGRHDAMVLAIAHCEGERVVLDCLRIATPPFDPETVVRNFAATLQLYRVGTVQGDRYAAEWVSSAFGRANIGYLPSERDRSTIFVECLPVFAERRVALLDNARLIAELRGLERKPKPGGRDSVTHGPSGSDDVANAACGAIWMAAQTTRAVPGEATAVLSDFFEGNAFATEHYVALVSRSPFLTEKF